MGVGGIRERTILGGFRRPVPDDFAQVAPTLCVYQLMAHYRCGEEVAKRWLYETGIAAKPSRPAIPADFLERAKSNYLMALVRHYGVTQQTIQRWAAKSKIILPAYVPTRKERPVPPKRSPIVFRGPKAPYVPGRDGSLHGSAAEHLRRYAAVYRCQERGRADPNGEFYRYGNTVLTPDELLIRAKRRGWEMVA